MAVDRYTKAVLTLIAVCLVWLSLGGPSLITPASAQGDTTEQILLRGWVDEKGNVVRFPQVPDFHDPRASVFTGQAKPLPSYPLPTQAR